MKQTTTNRLALFSVLWMLISAFSFTQAQTVYITKTGEKYHLGDCRYLASSKIAIAKQDAVSKGYGACLVCKPGGIRQGTSPGGVERFQQIPVYPAPKAAAATQCTGKTQTGQRCKNMTKSPSGRCHYHD